MSSNLIHSSLIIIVQLVRKQLVNIAVGEEGLTVSTLKDPFSRSKIVCLNALELNNADAELIAETLEKAKKSRILVLGTNW